MKKKNVGSNTCPLRGIQVYRYQKKTHLCVFTKSTISGSCNVGPGRDKRHKAVRRLVDLPVLINHLAQLVNNVGRYGR